MPCGPSCARCRGAGLIADGSVLKCNADKIALPPDHAALADGMKLVKAQFEIQRQQIEGVQFNAGAGIRDVLNAAREDPALLVKEQQRVFRNRRPRNRSAVEFHSGYQQYAPGPDGPHGLANVFGRLSPSAFFVNNQF